ncbi:MAG: hypothetical protein ACE15E_23215 [Acidobacteriota bacterium]
MPYVRKKGKQLLLVHGEREPESGQVQQRVLFTIYSKPEALAIAGKSDARSAGLFEALLSAQYPDLRFDWKAIRAAVARDLDVLPEGHEYRHERVEKRFRHSLVSFARQLFLADPQSLLSAADLIKTQRHELEVIRELIE